MFSRAMVPLTPREKSPWKKTFQHFKDSIQEMEAAVERGEYTRSSEVGTDNEDMVFTAATWKQRWKYYRTFTRLARSLLFSGSGKLILKRKANGPH